MARLMSFAKTVKQFEVGLKDVTRRDGWKHLKTGDVIEGIEWGTWVGSRWVCSCGQVCSPQHEKSWCIDPNCYAGIRTYRVPRRLGFRTVKSVSRERLGDITPEEVIREGFPGMSPRWFVAMYCAPRKPDPDRFVTRIEFGAVNE